MPIEIPLRTELWFMIDDKHVFPDTPYVFASGKIVKSNERGVVRMEYDWKSRDVPKKKYFILKWYKGGVIRIMIIREDGTLGKCVDLDPKLRPV